MASNNMGGQMNNQQFNPMNLSQDVLDTLYRLNSYLGQQNLSLQQMFGNYAQNTPQEGLIIPSNEF